MPAEKCITLLEDKLSQFGLSLSSDIVGICTDGASIMMKVWKVAEVEHGVQLAVLDVLYHRKLECAYNTTASDASACERDSDDDDQVTRNWDALTSLTTATTAELSQKYHLVVNKVRAVVKIFKRSPTKNDENP